MASDQVTAATSFGEFERAIVDLIVLRRGRLDALPMPDPDLEADIHDPRVTYLELVDKTTPTEREAIGEFYREALEVFGSNEELSQRYPSATGLLLGLRCEASRDRMKELLRLFKRPVDE